MQPKAKDGGAPVLKKPKLEMDVYSRPVLSDSPSGDFNVVQQLAGTNALVDIPTTKTLMLDQISEKEKLKQKGLLKDKKERPRRHPARLGRKKLRELSKLDQDDFSFDDMRVLHRMWTEYMTTLLGKSTVSNDYVCASILRAELVGSYLTVVESKTPEWIGKSGIVFVETMHSFKWITSDNRKMTILKSGNVFAVQICGYLIKLYGNQLVCRPGERSSKNLKSVPTIEL